MRGAIVTPLLRIEAALSALRLAAADHRAEGEHLRRAVADHRAATVGLEMGLRAATTEMRAADRPRALGAGEREGGRRPVRDGVGGVAPRGGDVASSLAVMGLSHRAAPSMADGAALVERAMRRGELRGLLG